MLPQRNISLLSNRLAKEGGRRIQESVLERDYCLAWFLCALAESDLKPILAFKVGTALKRYYFGDYRFSEDLDFTLLEPIGFDELAKRLLPVYAAVRDASGIEFNFDREDRQKHENTYTFYLRYVGPLPSGNNVKVDATLREKLVYPLREPPILRGYEEFSDLPENRLIRVYSLEEIATEKVLALADGARNEPRDLYGSGLDDAGNDHGDDEIALSAWSGAEDVLQVKVTQTTQDRGNMAMRQGAGDVEGVRQRGRGGSQRAGQGQAEGFKLLRGEMSDVGDGASLDFAVETIGFAKEDGGRGVAVGYGGNVHAYVIINYTYYCKHI